MCVCDPQKRTPWCDRCKFVATPTYAPSLKWIEREATKAKKRLESIKLTSGGKRTEILSLADLSARVDQLESAVASLVEIVGSLMEIVGRR